MTKRSAESERGLSLNGRLAVISASLLLMALVGHDLQRRVEGSTVVADAAAADRDPPDEATLQGEEIDGPAVVAAYFRQGYAWAEAHGVTSVAKCSSANRAHRDGCRAYVNALK